MFRTKMLCKTISARCALLTFVVVSGAVLGQQTPSAPSSSSSSHSPSIELPVTMRQNVTAGTTAIGTKVQAKLLLATLVSGIVIPVDAVLSGEVTESAAKSLRDPSKDPSRLAIRMDSAQWKNGSVPLKFYLTAWYYPAPALTLLDSELTPPDSNPTGRSRNRGGIYPNPNLNPGTVPASDPSSPAPGSSASKHRVLMKDVESIRNSDGTVTLTSKRANIKLDKQTTYVLASGELLPLN